MFFSVEINTVNTYFVSFNSQLSTYERRVSALELNKVDRTEIFYYVRFYHEIVFLKNKNLERENREKEL